MNNKQKLNQIKLNQWVKRFQEQAVSGLTAKAWCEDNSTCTVTILQHYATLSAARFAPFARFSPYRFHLYCNW